VAQNDEQEKQISRKNANPEIADRLLRAQLDTTTIS
jgi:hypothetical protein